MHGQECIFLGGDDDRFIHILVSQISDSTVTVTKPDTWLAQSRAGGQGSVFEVI